MPRVKTPRNNRRLLYHSKTRSGRAPKKQSKTLPADQNVLSRSVSEPMIKIAKFSSYLDDDINDGGLSLDGCVGLGLNKELFIYEGFFASAPLLPHPSPRRAVFREESKVVVNVTVEGSPGPVRAMVKLGATVNEAIGLVLEEYRREGRSPKFSDSQTDVDSFQLHHSHFNLQSLNKSQKIGELGSRSFYLRKGCSSHEYFIDSAVEERCVDDNIGNVFVGNSNDCLTRAQLFFFRRISKMMRRAKRLWRLVICITCL